MAPQATMSRKQRWLWTFGNVLMFAGVYVFLYVGGIYAMESYYREAARGDNQLELPEEAAVENISVDSPQAIVSSRTPEDFKAPALNVASAGTNSSPQQPQRLEYSTVSRIQIPSIDVDSKVIEVGWAVENGKTVWQVAKFAVGHHKGSANPGEDENIVMAGHVGGAGPVFARLIEVQAGEQIILYTGTQQYLYTVQEVLRVQEVGVSDEQRLENASYMNPQGSEMLTLITCWPATGPHAFDQRIIVRATPFESTMPLDQANWSLR